MTGPGNTKTNNHITVLHTANIFCNISTKSYDLSICQRKFDSFIDVMILINGNRWCTFCDYSWRDSI